jgi:hypothetical protein
MPISRHRYHLPYSLLFYIQCHKKEATKHMSLCVEQYNIIYEVALTTT